MPFENGAATDASDLLQKLEIFLAANGWTSDRSAVEGSGWTVTMHNGSDYVHFRSSINEVDPAKHSNGSAGYSINLYMGSAYSSGSTFNAQITGAPLQSNDSSAPLMAAMALLNAGITNYYFFLDAANENCVVVAQKASGVYAAMGFGLVLANQCGTITGGQYFWGTTSGYFAHDVFGQSNIPGQDATCNPPGTCGDNYSGTCTYMKVDVDSFTGKWISLTPQSEVGVPQLGFTGKEGASPVAGWPTTSSPAVSDQIPGYAPQGQFSQAGSFQGGQTSAIDGRANLLPILLWARRDGSGLGFSPIGELPFTKLTGVASGFSAGSDYTIGGDTYTMFPFFAVQKFV